jgi:CRP-like cAMP-binding protein
MFNVLLAHIQEKVTHSVGDVDLLKSFLIPKKLRKRQYILPEGDVCKYLMFVEKGLLRMYHVDDKGAEHMIQFAWEGW